MMHQPGDKIIRLALDAMGGDKAPEAVIKGAELSRKRFPHLRFQFFGDTQKIAPILARYAQLKALSTIVHTEDVISDDEKPSIAVRKGRNSSLALAIKAVRDGKAEGIVSAGNTGALMALGKLLLHTLPGIDRPAIGGDMPTTKGYCVMLDLGGNVSCDADNLFEFAVMGHAFANAYLGIENPSIGLLNIGTEETKGHEAVQTAAAMLRASDLPLNFKGFVEGNDINTHGTDVVISDGFTGNIALKTVEGTATMIVTLLKRHLKASIWGRIGALIARPALKKFAEHFDPELNNGAIFLGLNGVVIKSHGGMGERGFAQAILVAERVISNRVNDKIVDEMVKSGHIPPLEKPWQAARMEDTPAAGDTPA